MNNAEIQELAVVVTDVYELYGRECSDGVHRLWWEALKGYALGEVRQAFSRHVTNPDGGQFVPKPADILKILNGGGETRALQAWTQVDQAVRRIGPWESVVFDDALIHAVIADMGGWPRFGQITDDEWPFVRNEFIKRYQGYRLRPPTEFPRALSGHFVQQNARVGADAPLPRLVGNAEEATRTYLAGQEIRHAYPYLASDLVKGVVKRLGSTQEVSPVLKDGDGDDDA